jgi:hypothetical protein
MFPCHTPNLAKPRNKGDKHCRQNAYAYQQLLHLFSFVSASVAQPERATALPSTALHRLLHRGLGTLLFVHCSAFAPLSVFASPWVANPHKGRIRQSSCFYQSHAFLRRVLYQTAATNLNLRGKNHYGK